MIELPFSSGEKYGVYGLGATGLSVCEALSASGAEVFCFDESAEARARTQNTKYQASHPKEWPWKELAALVLSPGVPLTHPAPHVIVRKARQEKVEIIGDVELFARALNAIDEAMRPRVIAITGSNGKSTTTALIGHILKDTGRDVHVGGNIGKPLLALPAMREGAVYVLELSSFQLDLAKTFRANTAILLNITPDHIDRHGSIEGYAAAKKRIFHNQTPDDLAIIGVDDTHTQAICAEMMIMADRQIAPVSTKGSLGRGVFALGGRLFYTVDGKTGEAGDISRIESLRGAHNWQNAAAALAAVRAEGVAPAVAIKSMGRYESLPHRMQIVGRLGKVAFVNDSKATNADAAANALRAYDDIYWIAGGKAKDGGVASVVNLMSRVRGAYLIGDAAKEFEGQLGDAASCFQCGDLETATRRAARDAAASGHPAPVVLLSPACASYDQFRNFEERGEMFRRLVQSVIAAAGDANGAAA